jgi:hypothetical protein
MAFDPTKIDPRTPGPEDPGLEAKKKKLAHDDGKLSKDPTAGLDNTVMNEKQPEYTAASSEYVVENPVGGNNARIILGRDRNLGQDSGYGGRGHTRSGAIDLVVGLQGWNPGEKGRRNLLTGEWIRGKADKSFGSMNNDKPGDAARIYISQRADIDNYFDLCPGGVGQSIADSAIGIKADSVRIMARKGIKLVTGKAPPGRNSLDGKLDVTYGIDLIAGNRDVINGLLPAVFKEPNQIQYLQPIPKGYNLEEALVSITKRIMRLNAILQGICKGIMYIAGPSISAKAVLSMTGGTAVPNLDDIVDTLSFVLYTFKAMIELRLQALKLTDLELNYLSVSGKKYINSRHNRTN